MVTIGIIFGAGTLPFRGHLDLKNAENFFREYRGIGTIILQSALRYSHEKGDAKALVSLAKARLPESPEIFSCEEKEEIVNLIGIFGARYGGILKEMAPMIKRIADLLQYFTNWIRKSSSFIPISKYFSVKCLKS